MAGCAAASSTPGLLNVRQVVLLQHPKGYISIIFGNPDAHRIDFTVKRDGGVAVYTKDSAIGAVS